MPKSSGVIVNSFPYVGPTIPMEEQLGPTQSQATLTGVCCGSQPTKMNDTEAYFPYHVVVC